MAIKVIIPNSKFNGEDYGVKFKDGVAIFEDEARGRNIADSLRYEVEEIEKPKPKAKPAPKKTTAKKPATKKPAPKKVAKKEEPKEEAKDE